MVNIQTTIISLACILWVEIWIKKDEENDETNKDVLCIGIDKHTINTTDKGKLFVTPSNLILHTDTLETKSYDGIDYISIKTSGIIDNQSIKSYFKYIPDENGGKHNFDLINYDDYFEIFQYQIYLTNAFVLMQYNYILKSQHDALLM